MFKNSGSVGIFVYQNRKEFKRSTSRQFETPVPGTQESGPGTGGEEPGFPGDGPGDETGARKSSKDDKTKELSS